jgi:hypothetical protein
VLSDRRSAFRASAVASEIVSAVRQKVSLLIASWCCRRAALKSAASASLIPPAATVTVMVACAHALMICPAVAITILTAAKILFAMNLGDAESNLNEKIQVYVKIHRIYKDNEKKYVNEGALHDESMQKNA